MAIEYFIYSSASFVSDLIWNSFEFIKVAFKILLKSNRSERGLWSGIPLEILTAAAAVCVFIQALWQKKTLTVPIK